ncbi:MAG: phosphoglycerate dehydrogenase, partial [Hyphomicrobiales bacterium]
YEGDVAEMNTKALTAAALSGLMQPLLQTVNMVSAPIVARDRGIKIEEVARAQEGAYENYIRLTITTEKQERSVAGTVFSDGKLRIIQIKGINMDGGFSSNMLYITNYDKPGFIGRLGTMLGKYDVNVATFNLGRKEQDNEAIALLAVDGDISEDLLRDIGTLEGVIQVKSLQF